MKRALTSCWSTQCTSAPSSGLKSDEIPDEEDVFGSNDSDSESENHRRHHAGQHEHKESIRMVDSANPVREDAVEGVNLDKIGSNPSKTTRKRGLDVMISHIKVRGRKNLINQRHRYFLVFTWSGISQQTSERASFRQGCSWDDEIVKYEYQSVDNLDPSEKLSVELFTVGTHFFNKGVKSVGKYEIQIANVMNAPIHHNFSLQDAGFVVSYNLRVTEVANWTLAMTDLQFKYKENRTHMSSEATELAETGAETRYKCFQVVATFSTPDGIEAEAVSPVQKLFLSTKAVAPHLEDTVEEALMANASHGEETDEKGSKRRGMRSSRSKELWGKLKLHVINDTLHDFDVYKGCIPELEPLEFFGTLRSILRGTVHLQLFEVLQSLRPNVNNRRMLGECWISMNRLHGKAVEAQARSTPPRFRKVDLWYLGQIEGNITSSYSMTPLPKHGQSSGGLLTENGVSLLSRTILGEEESAAHDEEISGYPGHLANQIKAFINEFQVVHVPSQAHSRISEDLLMEKKRREYKTSHGLLKLLKTSEKESIMCYFYKNHRAMLQVTHMLVKLWLVLIDWIDAVRVGVRCWFFELIYAIMARAEVSSMLCESMRNSNKSRGVRITKYRKDLFDAALEVRGLMFSTLAWVLNVLNREPRFNELRLFSSRVVAIMCMRIPVFGKLIERELLGTTAALRRNRSYVAPSESIINKVDNEWQVFHEDLTEYYRSKSSKRLEEQEGMLPSSIDWFKQLRQHRGIYYDLCQQIIINTLTMLAPLTTETVVPATSTGASVLSTGVQWNELTLYRGMVRKFLEDLENIDVSHIPEEMLRLSMLLLIEPANLTLFCNVLLRKCSVHNTEAVINTLDIISAWFVACWSWPGRLKAERIFRLYGPFTPNGALIVLDRSKGELFSRVEEALAVETKNEMELIEAAMMDDSAISFVSGWEFDRLSLYSPFSDVKDTCSWPSNLYRFYSAFLPEQFDLHSLFKALWILLHSERFQIIQRTVEFLQNHWQAFPPHFRNRIRCMMLICVDEPLSITRDVYDIAQHFKRQDREKLVNADFAEEVPVFVRLFFHWSKPVRYFFHVFLAHSLCSKVDMQESNAAERILAATRIALNSTNPEICTVLWGADNCVEIFRNLENPLNTGNSVVEKTVPLSPRVTKKNKAKGKGLFKLPLFSRSGDEFTFEGSFPKTIFQDYASSSKAVLTKIAINADDINLFKRRRASMDKSFETKQQQQELLGTGSANRKPRKRANSMNEHVQGLVFEKPGASKSQSGQPAEETSSSYTEEDLAADLARCAWVQWPKRFMRYAPLVVREFRPLYNHSLTATTAPELETNTVVEENGHLHTFGAAKKLNDSLRAARRRPLY